MMPERDPAADEGATIALVVSMLLALSSLGNFGIQLLMTGGEGWSLTVFILLVGLAIAWCVFKGYAWARTYAAFIAGLGAITLAMKVVSLRGTYMALWMAICAVVYALCAWMIWSSRSLQAYCEQMDRQRNPPVSMSDIDGE